MKYLLKIPLWLSQNYNYVLTLDGTHWKQNHCSGLIPRAHLLRLLYLSKNRRESYVKFISYFHAWESQRTTFIFQKNCFAFDLFKYVGEVVEILQPLSWDTWSRLHDHVLLKPKLQRSAADRGRLYNQVVEMWEFMKLTFKEDNNPKRFSSESESNLVQKSGVKIEVSESCFAV